MSLSGAPVNYTQPYNNPNQEDGFDYPICNDDWVTKKLLSPYTGEDVVAQYLSWVNDRDDTIFQTVDSLQPHQHDIDVIFGFVRFVIPVILCELFLLFSFSKLVLLLTALFLFFMFRSLYFALVYFDFPFPALARAPSAHSDRG